MTDLSKYNQLSQSTHWLLCLFLIVFLAACGGGGGNGGILDTIAPVITLNGENSITLTQGDTYTEAGATATDDRDGSVDVAISGTVDTNIVGVYIVTYSASDSAGNASSLTRTIAVVQAPPFITTWKTDNFGQSNSDQIKIGTSGSGYNYQVDWGDGLTDSNVTGDITHTYAVEGTYTVTISGDFPRMFFGYAGYDGSKILTIEQWGSQQWQSMNMAFYNCSNLISNAIDVPDLSQVTDMSEMFGSARAFNQDLSGWNVASVTNMNRMFVFARDFNQDLSSWNVASVTDMSGMFAQATTFNQDLSSWNVASVTDMSGMFSGATAFNQALSSWDVESVTDMSEMFSGATTFNQDLSGWNLSSLIDMSFMFSGASNFNQDLSSWNVMSVTNMGAMFRFASAFNQDLSSWNVASVIFMYDMFSDASVFNQDLSNWNVSSVILMNSMFVNAGDFNQDLSNWDVSSVINMSGMFSGATIFNQDLSGWDVSLVTDMSGMFSDASVFNQNLSSWNVASVTDMNNMFSNVTLSTSNYDALLSGWSVQTLQNNVWFSGGSSTYSVSSQGDRDTLTNVYNWTVIDGGVAP